jgi:hypothetical protein
MEVTADEQVYPVAMVHVTMLLELGVFDDVSAAHAFPYRKFKPLY